MSTSKEKSPQALVASAIRKELKELKLNIKFSVRSDSAAAMTAVRITLINPTPLQVKIVKEIASKYQDSVYYGFEKSYEYKNNNSSKVTHAVIITEYDDELRQQALDYTVKHYNIKEDVDLSYMHKQYVTVNENFGKEVLSDLFYSIFNGRSGNFWSHR